MPKRSRDPQNEVIFNTTSSKRPRFIRCSSKRVTYSEDEKKTIFEKLQAHHIKEVHRILGRHISVADIETVLNRAVNELYSFNETNNKNNWYIKKLIDTTFNQTNALQANALQAAIRESRFKIIQTLLKYGPDLTVQDSEGNTLLHLTILCCKADKNTAGIMKLLLTQGVDPNIANKNGDFPLHLAARVEKANFILAPLIEHRAHPYSLNASQNTPLQEAMISHQMENVISLLEEVQDVITTRNYINTKHDGKTILGQALEYRVPCEIIKALMRHGADATLCKGGEIAYPIEQRSYIRTVLNEKIPTRFPKEQSLPEKLNIFFKYSVERDQLQLEKETILHRALQQVTTEKKTVELLKTYHDKINTKDFVKQTPLFYVCDKSIEIIQQLVSSGASLNIRNGQGITPMHYMIQNNPDSALAEYIVKNISQNRDEDLINAKDAYGTTLLMQAVISQQKSWITELCKAGADKTKQNQLGDTILHLLASASVHNENLPIDMLICPENINLVNKDGQTALHLAIATGCISLVNKLSVQNTSFNSFEGVRESMLPPVPQYTQNFVTEFNYSPLERAIKNEQLDRIQDLLSQENLNEKSYLFNNLLFFAIDVCSSENLASVINLLLAAGIDPLQDNDEGKSSIEKIGERVEKLSNSVDKKNQLGNLRESMTLLFTAQNKSVQAKSVNKTRVLVSIPQTTNNTQPLFHVDPANICSLSSPSIDSLDTSLSSFSEGSSLTLTPQ